MINPGATPKLTRSARLSSSLPNSEYAFKALAANPSRKSKTMAARINQEAVIKSPFRMKIIERNPEARLREVIRLGMCFNSSFSHYGKVKLILF